MGTERAGSACDIRNSETAMDTRIYVCTHKQYAKPEDPLYRSLHVGCAISEDLGYEGDNTGDHISERNKSFCELTGLYWIWKNVQCDIVGICHYRRYFMEDDAFLTKGRIEELLSAEYDTILPTSSFTHYKNTREHYAHEHFEKDLLILRDILADLSPDSLTAFDLTLNCNLMSAWNMLITRKKIFDEYCSWLFPILFEAEKRIDISSYDTFQGRLFGYLSERLIRVFFLDHTYRIFEQEVQLIDPSQVVSLHQMIPPIERLTKLKINDLLTVYRSGNYVDIVESTPAPIDFHGKLPVFVCWWQGFDSAPDLVQLCRKSLHRHLPKNLVEIHEITLKNYTDYLTFPDWILKRFEAGVISYTMLSDLLRIGLLYHHGGLWIDATYFLSEPLPEEILSDPSSFQTIRSEGCSWKGDVAEGKWAINFLKLPKGSLLAKFLWNAYLFYFISNDTPVHYFMTDFLIRIACQEFSEVLGMIDSCHFMQPSALRLQDLLNETFRREDWNALKSDTCLFKLSYKTDLQKKDLLERDTYWGHLSR